ncbi:hypothetical protein [Nocardioides sp. WS12]|uniref:hypothetical protein n=1 Tax=Nocardioides sp. WS12 TaxID=2486272 RepID=UPI0015F884E9|nr:hypothetical protein [Nocardioides sp. WS12]
MTEVQKPPETLPMKIVVNILLAVVMIFPLVLVGSGLWLLGQRQFGEKVEAEVLHCDIDIGYKASKQYCTARWTQDGVVHTGPIQGSGDNEVGDTVTATIRGDELYSRSLGLPLILLGLGLPFCVLPYSFVRRKLRRT